MKIHVDKTLLRDYRSAAAQAAADPNLPAHSCGMVEHKRATAAADDDEKTTKQKINDFSLLIFSRSFCCRNTRSSANLTFIFFKRSTVYVWMLFMDNTE